MLDPQHSQFIDQDDPTYDDRGNISHHDAECIPGADKQCAGKNESSKYNVKNDED